MAKHVLIVDDDVTVVETMRMILEDLGHSVDTFTVSSDGLKAGIERNYDLIMVDLRMPGVDGATVAERIISSRPAATVLVITGQPGDPLVHRALAAGVKAIIKKPFELAKVMEYLKP